MIYKKILLLYVMFYEMTYILQKQNDKHKIMSNRQSKKKNYFRANDTFFKKKMKRDILAYR